MPSNEEQLNFYNNMSQVYCFSIFFIKIEKYNNNNNY